MKKLLLVLLALVAGCTTAYGQNVEGQPIAAQYGSWIVHGLTPNTYSFVVPACVQQGGSKTFHPFSTVAPFAPIKIVDTNPAMTEVVTPTAAVDTNQTCSITVSPVNKHNSFYITSATGGLQEALNANRATSTPNTIVLTAQWYQQGGTSGIINTVVGNANLNLVDVTTVPYNWYQWNGSQYTLVSIGGGGSGAFPAGAQFSLQYNGNGTTMFGGATNTFYQPSTHTLSVADALMVRESIENLPRLEYDTMNPAYAGGMAAARTDPTGVAQAAVVNAALDASQCNVQMGIVPAYGHIILPSQFGTLAVSGIKVWGTNELSGPSYGDVVLLQHTDNTQPMITGHAPGDALTCSDGNTYHPLQGSGLPAGQVYVHDLGIAGMGAGASGRSSDRDIGIWSNGFSWIVENIVQYGNAFGSQAILNGGTEDQFLHLGKVGGQINACAAYKGNVPVSSSPDGQCAALDDHGLDTRADDIYASDGGGHTQPIGPCYPNCAAIIQAAAGSRFTGLFTQVSDIGLIIGNTGTITDDVRIDDSSTNAILDFASFGAGNSTLSNVVITSACTAASGATAYNAGQPTNCYGVANYGQNVAVSNILYNTSPGLFGPSYMQGLIFDNGVGASAAPNTYSNIGYNSAPSNNTPNDQKFVGQFQGDYASGKVEWASGGFIQTNSATPNVNGTTKLLVVANISITNLLNGIGGQPLQITSNVPGATITPGGTIHTCNGATVPIYNVLLNFTNTGGFANGNTWTESCDGGAGGGGGGTGTLNFTGTPATNALTKVTGASTIGASSTTDDGTTTTFNEPVVFNGSGTADQLNFPTNGTAPAVPSTGAAIGVNASVTTPAVYLLPDAPPASGGGFLFDTNLSGVVTQAYVAPSQVYGTCTGCTTPPVGVYTVPALVSDYSGGTGTDNSAAVTTAFNNCTAAGITCRFFFPDGNYGFGSAVSYTGHNDIEVYLSPNANLHALSSWSSGTALGIFNFNDTFSTISGPGNFYAHGLSECVKAVSTNASYVTSTNWSGATCDSSAGQGFDALSSVFNLPAGPQFLNGVFDNLKCTTNSALACLAVRQGDHMKVSRINAFAPCSGAGVATGGCGGIDLQSIDDLSVSDSTVQSMPYTIPTGGNPIGAFHLLEVSNFSLHNNHVTGGGQATPGTVTQQAANAGYYLDTDFAGTLNDDTVEAGGIGMRCEVCQDVQINGIKINNVSSNGAMANARLSNLHQLAPLNQSDPNVTAGSNITQTVDNGDFPTGSAIAMTALVSVSGTTVTTLSGDCCAGVPSGTAVTINGNTFTTASNGTATGTTLTASPGTFSSTSFTAPFQGSLVSTFGSGFTSGPMETIATGAGTPSAGLNWPITPVTRLWVKSSVAIPYGSWNMTFNTGSTVLSTFNLPGVAAGTWVQLPPIWTTDFGYKLRGTNTVTSVAINFTSSLGSGATVKIANLEQTTPGANVYFNNPHISNTASNGIFLQGPFNGFGVKGGDISNWATLYGNTTCTIYCSTDPISGISIQPNKDGGEIAYNAQVTGVSFSMAPGINPYAKTIRFATSGTSSLFGGLVEGNNFAGMNFPKSQTLATTISQDSATNNFGLYIAANLNDTLTNYSFDCRPTGTLGNPIRCSNDFAGGSAGAQIYNWRNTTFTGGAVGEFDILGTGTSVVDTSLQTRAGTTYFFGSEDGISATNTRSSVCFFCRNAASGGVVQFGVSTAGEPFTIGLYGNFSSNNATAYGSVLVLPQDTPAAPAVTPTGGASSSIGYYLIGIDNQGGLSAQGPTTTITSSAATLSTSAYNQIAPPSPTTKGSTSYFVYRDTNGLGLATGCLGTLTLGNAVVGTPTTGNGQNLFFDTGQTPITCNAGPAPTGTFQTHTGFSLVNGTSQYSSTIEAASGMAGSHIQTLPNLTGTIPVYTEAAITSATPGTGVTATCSTATCTNMSGTYQITGGSSFTTGAFVNLVWPATPTAYKCTVTQSGGTSWYGIIHGTATATGMSITSQNSINGASFNVDYQCVP